MSKKVEFHGSDLEKIEEYYHIPKEEIVRFGANVNPLGLPQKAKSELCSHLDIISSYPDRNYTALKQAIGAYCGCSSENVVVGNGSTELISLLISQRNAKKALILGPTYSEYARELSLTGGEMHFYNLKESDGFILNTQDLYSTLSDGFDFLILCNPNNPTSSLIGREQMLSIVSYCKEHHIFVMIDETYAEFAPVPEDATSIPLTSDYDNLMIIRGVSKFFAAPGLRFGYGITSNREFLSMLLTHQNPWSLNSIGAFMGEIMLSDQEYIQKTRTLIDSERTRMYNELQKLDTVKVYPAFGNFILVRILKEGVTSFDVFESAIRQKMMIRDCSSFESLDGEFVRFCIMNPEDNTRLLQVFKNI